MLQQIQLRLKPEIAASDLRLKVAVSTALDTDVNRIKQIDTLKKSIDARQRNVMINMTLRVHIDEITSISPALTTDMYHPVGKDAPQAIVVGAGPAGLFAALRLIEEGIKPILLERGRDVDGRRQDLAKISRENVVDPDSNYCFGEGGAGAFSDGKLYTRSKKRGSVDKVLNIFHAHGAKADILSYAHPHIGSDKLPMVIKSMRETIIRCGGVVKFGTRVNKLLISDSQVLGVGDADGNEYFGPVILATGHSARDVYRLLHDNDIKIEAKGLAVGVRLEHPQELIDRIFYHSPNGRGKYLPAAEYSLLTRVDDRAVYSFCMCPGGYIIPAASAPGEMVVNGMSPSNRGTRWANSGMVVEVLPEDVPGDSPLRMLEYQQSIEQAFFREAGQTQNAPAQAMQDFVNGKDSTRLSDSSYTAGIHAARVDRLLPKPISNRLRQGFKEFGRKYKGFLTNEATVIGDETRTSSPVRIIRDPESLQHIEIGGLYPCGEGAGYAGGIVSAAIDGDRCAAALAAALREGAPQDD